MFCHIKWQKALENIQIQSTYKGGSRRVPNVSLKIWIHSKKVACHFSATVTVSGDKKKLENRCNLNYNFKNIMQNID